VKKADQKYNLECFFELSPDLLCVAGYDGYFKKINPAVSKTLGYTDEELFAQPINSFIYADDKEMTASKRHLITKGIPLLNFENRYVTKTGEIVWLTWTSMPIKAEKLVFAIAKNITHKKKLEEYQRLLHLLSYNKGEKVTRQRLITMANFEQNDQPLILSPNVSTNQLSDSEQAWLLDFETLVRKYTGKIKLNIRMLSNDLCIGERQLHRRLKALLGVTPNKFIRIIRLQMAKEAIASGKNNTLAEISSTVGFETPAYFKKLFRQTYNREVGSL
jgi:PAS domain S-box-containing protein